MASHCSLLSSSLPNAPFSRSSPGTSKASEMAQTSFASSYASRLNFIESNRLVVRPLKSKITQEKDHSQDDIPVKREISEPILFSPFLGQDDPLILPETLPVQNGLVVHRTASMNIADASHSDKVSLSKKTTAIESPKDDSLEAPAFSDDNFFIFGELEDPEPCAKREVSDRLSRIPPFDLDASEYIL